MAQVRWSARSQSDLQSIYEFVRRDSPDAALALMARLISSVRRLEEFPLSGRIVPEFRRRNMREVIVGSFRVVYEVAGEEVGVVTVRNASRRLTLGDLKAE